MKNFRIAVFLLLLVFVSGSLFAFSRDWEKYPAYVEITGANRVCAIGDIHGAFEELTASLNALNVAKLSSTEKFRFDWIGKDTVLVFTGDFNDRGLNTKQIYDAIIDLQSKAAKTGGQIIVTLGNHEAMLLNGQIENWAKTLTSHKKQHYQNTIDSFTRDGLDFHQAISEKGTYGIWIRNRPLFAVVNGYMFVHGGLPKVPTTKSNLAASYRDSVTKGDYSKGIFMNHDMVLWNRDWWKDDILVSRNLKVLGVMGVVFGHTVGALGTKGTIQVKDNRLISIDIGMTPAYGNSNGGGLEILRTDSGRLTFTAFYPDRPSEHLFDIEMSASAY
ncbi:MAG: metallophosphoesterase [Candidatus Riflebacteria bacterium]|nr:metallophosphoesterase [Candidatus Riflebacteria bacterium]